METQEQLAPTPRHFRVENPQPDQPVNSEIAVENPQPDQPTNPEVVKVNTYLKGLSAIETWKDEKFKGEIDKVRSDPSEQNLQTLYDEASIVDDLVRHTRLIPQIHSLSVSSETREIHPDEVASIAEECLGAELPSKETYSNLETFEAYTLQKVEELSAQIGLDETKIDPKQVHSFDQTPGNIWKSLSSISHDLVYPSSNIKSAVELLKVARPQDRDILLNIISDTEVLLERTLDKSYGILSETYPKEVMDTGFISREIHSIMTRKLRDDYGIETVFMNSTQNVEQIGSVVWSQPWLATLLGNIVQNEAKAYRGAKPIELVDENGETKQLEPNKVVRVWQNRVDPNNLQIVFEDEAGGIQDERILREGFGHGRGGWQSQEENTGKRVESTRIGMAEQAEALQKYGGTMVAVNYETPEGRKGARIFINLPLTQ